MKLVDVHAHLDFPEYAKDLDKVLKKAEESGVKAIIANGVHKESNRSVLEIAKKFPVVKPALGFYPTHTWEFKEEEVDEELDFIRKNRKKAAIGEVGLDYKYSEGEKDADKKTRIQKKFFEKIIVISEKTRKPLIIHSRKAELDVIEMLESSRLKNPVLHCFSGKKKLMQRAADNNWNFTVPVIVFKSQQFQDMVNYVNLSKLLTETDGPYLGPVPSERNTPENVRLAIKKIAEIKKMDEIEVANNVFMNYQRLFL
jgi:TatD DNase family protein